MKANDKLIGRLIAKKKDPEVPIGFVHHFEGRRVAYVMHMLDYNVEPASPLSNIGYSWLNQVTPYEPGVHGIQGAIDVINKFFPGRKYKVKVYPPFGKKDDPMRQAEQIAKDAWGDEYKCPYLAEVQEMINRLHEISELCLKCSKENRSPYLYREIRLILAVWSTLIECRSLGEDKEDKGG